MTSSEVHTTYDPYAGYRIVDPSGPPQIDPPSPEPVLRTTGRGRYTISTKVAGRLEALAQSRYIIREITGAEIGRWQQVDLQARKLQGGDTPEIVGLDSEEQVLEPIAQSVYCSSAIEGEEIYREHVNLAIVGKGDPQNEAEREKDDETRVKAVRSIYMAYVWALGLAFPLEGGNVLTPDLITELHRRMFQSTRGEAAGRYKAEDNAVKRRDGTVWVRMLPASRVAEFLECLCNRLNRQFAEAGRTANVSKILSIAEFVCDYLAIHPFRDGNGRSARLLSTYLLERAGYHFARFYALDAVILERRVEYYDALFAAQRHLYMDNEDATPWIDFYIDAVYTQWLRAHEEIIRSR
jgi:Fic family protein